MKKILFILASIALATTVFAEDELVPVKCPSVEAIKAVGLSPSQYLSPKADVEGRYTFFVLDRYDTEIGWYFTISTKAANLLAAFHKASGALKTLSGNPPLLLEKKIPPNYICRYHVELKDTNATAVFKVYMPL